MLCRILLLLFAIAQAACVTVGVHSRSGLLEWAVSLGLLAMLALAVFLLASLFRR